MLCYLLCMPRALITESALMSNDAPLITVSCRSCSFLEAAVEDDVSYICRCRFLYKALFVWQRNAELKIMRSLYFILKFVSPPRR